MGTIEEFISKYHELSPKSLKKFGEIFTPKSFKKGDVIAGYNQTSPKFFILEKGVACSFITDSKGKELIRTLFTGVDVIASMQNITYQKLANAQYKCLTDCTVLATEISLIQELQLKHHDISVLFVKIFEKAYSHVIERLNSLTLLDAKERYLLLKETKPDIESQIPLYQIASYLNITPIQFSRIRKELYSK